MRKKERNVKQSHCVPVLLFVSVLVAGPATAQGPQIPSQTVVAAEKIKMQTGAHAAALAAAEAAVNAEKAAEEAAKAGKELADGAKAKEPALDQAALLKLIDAKSKAGRTAATAAREAANMALRTAAAVVIEPARAHADRAAGDAGRAAHAAEEAAAKVEKSATPPAAPAKPEDLDAVKKRVTDVAAAMEAVSSATLQAAAATSKVAEQAALPDLEVTTSTDNDRLSALRVRITGGAIFFNGEPEIVRGGTPEAPTTTVQSAQFSQATTYLAFEAQPQPLASRYNAARGYHRFYLEPFVNVRLTAVPVSGSTRAPGPIEVPDTSFQQTQKAAQIQFGAISSYNFGGFHIGETDFHWGVGPVVRGGFESVTDSGRALRVWNFEDDLYHAYSAGARLMLYERSVSERSNRKGWSPTAYLDVSAARFQRFEIPSVKKGLTPAETAEAESCLQAPQDCLAKGLPSEEFFTSKLKTRLYIEARLVLQFVYLGFDLDNGDGSDDLRFIGGLTMNLDQFFRRR